MVVRKLIFILIGLAVWSCKSPKPALSTDKDVQESANDSYAGSNKDSIAMSISKDVKRLYDKVNDLEVESKKTMWSAPDSTGRQYPLETTETNARKKTEERYQADESYKVDLHRMILFAEELNRKIDLLSKQKTVEVPQLTKWQRLKMSIGGIAILFAISFVCVAIAWLAIKIKKK